MATRQDDAKAKNGTATFYVHFSVEELAKQQGVEPVTDVSALAGNFWPQDESSEEFIETLASWRKEGNGRSKKENP
jgi:hypothetical protein